MASGFRLYVQRLSLRDFDLQLDQIQASHHLGHGMLNLDARVRFHEVKFAGWRYEELNRTDVGVPDRAA